jgi:hypothetical protein
LKSFNKISEQIGTLGSIIIVGLHDRLSELSEKNLGSDETVMQERFDLERDWPVNQSNPALDFSQPHR